MLYKLTRPRRASLQIIPVAEPEAAPGASISGATTAQFVLQTCRVEPPRIGRTLEKFGEFLRHGRGTFVAYGFAGISVFRLAFDDAHPCLSRQCALPSRQAGAAMAGAARLPHQAAFHSELLPASQSDRAAMGPDAQKRYAQQHVRSSPTRRSVSCANKFLAIGRTSAIRSPTTFASSRPRIFGS